MKAFAVISFGLLMSSASAAGFVKRQTTNMTDTDICVLGCVLESQEYPTQCDRQVDNPEACLCQDSAFMTSLTDCLNKDCTSAALPEALEYVDASCKAANGTGPAVENPSIQVNTTVPIGVNTTVGIGSLSASSTGAGSLSTISSISSAVSGSSVAPTTTSRPAASSASAIPTSSAWAMPTAAAGYMGAVFAAAGVAIAM